MLALDLSKGLNGGSLEQPELASARRDVAEAWDCYERAAIQYQLSPAEFEQEYVAARDRYRQAFARFDRYSDQLCTGAQPIPAIQGWRAR